MISMCHKTGMLDRDDPDYRGVAIEGAYEERANYIGEFHYILSRRNKNGSGRAYETYKGIDLFYDLPKQISKRTFEQEIQRMKELVVPGRWPHNNKEVVWVEREKPKVSCTYCFWEDHLYNIL